MQESENPLVIDEGDALGLFFLNDAPSNFRGAENLYRFLGELDEIYERIRGYPETGGLFSGHFRRYPFDNLPCVILYA